MRQLATVQKIKDIKNIEGKDRIQVATVLGYNVIIGKGIYEEDQHVCFFEIDSLFPKDKDFHLNSYKAIQVLANDICKCLYEFEIGNKPAIKYNDIKIEMNYNGEKIFLTTIYRES